MRGLQHSVIEIKDTENEEIERILVFLRPGRHKIEIAGTRQDAENILQKVKVRRSLPPVKIKPGIATAIAVGLLVAAALAIAIL